MKKLNLKSDVGAKTAYKKYLEENEDYDSVKITASPADITAINGKTKDFFEIKFTRQKEKYFGAATLTEWAAAIENPNHFWFVIAIEKKDGWEFIKYSPSEFMEFNTIPPFKTYFTLSISNGKSLPSKKETKSVRLTKERIIKMKKLMGHFKKSK